MEDCHYRSNHGTSYLGFYQEIIKTENIIQDSQHGFTEGKSSGRIISFLVQQVVKEKTTNIYCIILLVRQSILRQLIFQFYYYGIVL